MRTKPIITKLSNESVLLSGVESAKSLIALTDDEIGVAVPRVFIYSAAEKSGKNNLINALNQSRNQRFSVLTVAKTADYDNDYLEDVRDELFSVLLGWKIDENYSPISHIDGEVISISSRLIWWRDVFETESYLRG